MIGGIAKLVWEGRHREALSLFAQWHSAGILPDSLTFPCLLKACGKLKAGYQGKEIHAHVVKTGFHGDVYTATALIGMYMKVQCLDDALKMFDKMPERNLASFNAAISGFSQSGYCREALWIFKQVGLGGFRPNSVTVASALPACEIIEYGQQIHCFAVKLGVEMDIYVATAVVSMYSNCHELVSAAKVFLMIPDKNVVSYNAFISGLLQNGKVHVVLVVFNKMRESCSHQATSVTWISVLSACSDLSDIQIGGQVHGLIMKYDMSCDDMVGTALLDMYSKCGCWKSAYKIFNGLAGRRNLITWNSMISGMMLNDQCETAVELFENLESEGLQPDLATWNSMIRGFSQVGKAVEAFGFFKKMQHAGVTPSLKSITSILPACSVLSALRCGKEIHGHTIRIAIQDDEFMSTALIDMYMKCGYPSWSRKIFDCVEKSPDDPAIWNAMISGYGRNGENESAIEIFDQMKKEGVQPRSATFLGVLSACSHTGQVEKGWEIFRMMSRDYDLDPTSEHFGCMVDLLGRSGQLDEAWKLIKEIPKPTASAFASLLGACRCHSNAGLGEEMAERLLELDHGSPTPLVVLSNIYADQGRWRDVERIREMMNDRGLRKHSGCSLIGEAEKNACQ